MEEAFIAAWEQCRAEAEKLGIRMRPLDLAGARRVLAGHRDSDGFAMLARKGRLELSLEALAVDRRFTGLFSDTEANNALNRLLDAGYSFQK